MDLKDIYNGLPVKSKKYDCVMEVIRVDDISESIYCRPISSIDGRLKEMKAEDLIKIRRA